MSTPRPISRPIRRPFVDFPEVNGLLNDPSISALYFFEQTSVLEDASSNGIIGAITTAKWEGNSLSFDGTNDWVTTSSIDLSGTKQVSFFCLLKTPDIAGVAHTIFHQGTEGTNSIWAYTNGGEQVVVEVENNGGANNTTSSGSVALTADKWSTLSATCDVLSSSDEIKTYTNGVADNASGAAALADEVFEDSISRLGAQLDNDFPFTGNIGFFVLYSRILNSSEISKLHDFAMGLV
jgi:hypothetical protein